MAVRGPGPGPLLRWQIPHTSKVGDGGYLSSRSGQLTVLRGTASGAAQQLQLPGRGLQRATIQKLGRWKSSAYQLYIKTPRQELVAVSQHLAGSP